MKNTVILILSGLLLFSGSIAALGSCSICNNSNPVKHESVVINIMGKGMNTDVAPQYINQTILIPARATFESIGYEAAWDSVENIATFNDAKNHTIQLNLGDKNVIVDGNKYVLPYGITVKEGRLMVAPEIVETIGYWWQWNPNELVLNINKCEWTEQ